MLPLETSAQEWLALSHQDQAEHLHLTPERISDIDGLLELLGVGPTQCHSVYHQALMHTSYAYEHQLPTLYNYERLEFLGDAVLKLVISELLYDRYPDLREGELTKIRSVVVSDATLADIALEFDLGVYLLLGISELRTGGDKRASNLACAVEALLGALFLDGKLADIQAVLVRLFEPRLDPIAACKTKSNYKAVLQEYTQSQGWGLPHYITLKEEGPSHNKTFQEEVTIQGEVMGVGVGKTKKAAQQAAALMALEALGYTL